NAGMPHWSTVKRAALVTETLTMESGDVTPKLSVRRERVTERYRGVLTALHEGQAAPEGGLFLDGWTPGRHGGRMAGNDGFLNGGSAVDGCRVLAPTARHREAWAGLYAQYASFYGVEQTQHMRERVWGWLQGPAHELEGAIVLDGSGVPVGLAHYRT